MCLTVIPPSGRALASPPSQSQIAPLLRHAAINMAALKAFLATPSDTKRHLVASRRSGSAQMIEDDLYLAGGEYPLAIAIVGRV